MNPADFTGLWKQACKRIIYSSKGSNHK